MFEKAKTHLNAALKYCIDLNKETVNSFVISLANKNANFLNKVLHKLLILNKLDPNASPTKLFEKAISKAFFHENSYDNHPAIQTMRDNIAKRTESLKKDGCVGTIRYSKSSFQKMKDAIDYDNKPLFITIDTNKPDLGSFSGAINEMGVEKLNSFKEALQNLNKNSHTLTSTKASILKATLHALENVPPKETVLEVVEDLTPKEEAIKQNVVKKSSKKKTVKKVAKKTVKKK